MYDMMICYKILYDLLLDDIITHNDSYLVGPSLEEDRCDSLIIAQRDKHTSSSLRGMEYLSRDAMEISLDDYDVLLL